MTWREGTSSLRTCTTLRMKRWISRKTCANLKNSSRTKTATYSIEWGQLRPTTSRAIRTVFSIETETCSKGLRLIRKKLTIRSQRRKTNIIEPCRGRTSLSKINRISPSLPWRKWITQWWTRIVHFTMNVSTVDTTKLSKCVKPLKSWKSRRKNWWPGSKILMQTRRNRFSCWTKLSRRVQ